MAILKDNTNGTTIEGKSFRITELHENNLGDFHPIGRLNNMFTEPDEIKTDIFNILDTVSKSAYSLFNHLKNNRNPITNITYYPTKSMNRSQLVMHRTRIKELLRAELIKKAKTINRCYPIKKGSYMINPILLKCAVKQKEAEEMWNFLT